MPVRLLFIGILLLLMSAALRSFILVLFAPDSVVVLAASVVVAAGVVLAAGVVVAAFVIEAAGVVVAVVVVVDDVVFGFFIAVNERFISEKNKF